MSRRRESRNLGKLFMIILFISLFFYPSARATSGSGRGRIPTYTISPEFLEVNLNQTDQLAVTLSGGLSITKYVFNITVTKPDQVSYAIARYTVTTDANGSGMGEVSYPFGFHAGNTPPATELVGIYEVRVDQILPKYRYGVAASSFNVTSSLSLNILSPTVGTYVDRGTNISLIVLVDDAKGDPDSNVSVIASLPGEQGTIGIPRSQQSGIFASTYRIKWNDPGGLWNVTYRATDTSGNLGAALIGVNITAAALSIQAFGVYDSAGQSRNTFYNNETVNFRVQAAYPEGSKVASGAASIELVDPNGKVVVSLALVYIPKITAYQTLTGFWLNQTSLLGSWTAIVSVDSLGDGFGNVGPATTVSFQFIVAATPIPTSLGNNGNSQNPPQSFERFNFLPIALLGVLLAPPIALLKRKGWFDREYDVDLLIRQAGSTGFTLIEGGKQSGKSTAVDIIAGRTIEAGGNAILLTFEKAPAEVRTRMTQLGIDWNKFEEKGNLQIIDCSDISKSLNLGFVRSKLLNALGGKREPKAVFIDSLDLLYDELEEKQVQDMLIALQTEVKSTKGILYSTATPGNFPRSGLTRLENIAGFVLQAGKSSQSPVLTMNLRIKKAPPGSALTPEKALVIGPLSGSVSGRIKRSDNLPSTMKV